MLVPNKIREEIEGLNAQLAPVGRQFLGQCQSVGNRNPSVCKCIHRSDTTAVHPCTRRSQIFCAYYITVPIDDHKEKFYFPPRSRELGDRGICPSAWITSGLQSRPETTNIVTTSQGSFDFCPLARTSPIRCANPALQIFPGPPKKPTDSVSYRAECLMQRVTP